MRSIQFNVNLKRFWAILLVLVCVPLFSFSGGLNDGLTFQDRQILFINQDVISNHGIKHSTTNQGLLKDIFLQYQGVFQTIQELSCRRSNSRMTTFLSSAHSLLFLSFSCLVSLSIGLIFNFNRHLIIPHSIHAPPYIS